MDNGGRLNATILAAILTITNANAVLTFVAAGAALAFLAALIGVATDQIGSRLGAGATGVLQSALGNLPELFIGIFALQAGLVEVVQAALIGSILGNSLFVLGMAFTVGGLRHSTQKFASQTPRVIATLTLLVVAALAVPTLAHYLHTLAATHENELSIALTDAQRARQSNVFIQFDGRWTVRGSKGREHIFELNGELVTSFIVLMRHIKDF